MSSCQMTPGIEAYRRAWEELCNARLSLERAKADYDRAGEAHYAAYLALSPAERRIVLEATKR